MGDELAQLERTTPEPPWPWLGINSLTPMAGMMFWSKSAPALSGAAAPRDML